MNPRGPSSDKSVRISGDYPEEEFRKMCKIHKCTVNQACMAVLSQTIAQFFKLNNFKAD
jgi:hypothetical protein